MMQNWIKKIFLAAGLTTFFNLSAEVQEEQGVRSSNHYFLIKGLPEVIVSKETENIGATWKEGKVWDQPLIEQFYSLLSKAKKEIVVVDVGAQTGSFSLLAKYLPDSQWYAFEPISEAVAQLKVNLSLNAIKNVSVEEACVSNEAGHKILKLPSDTHWGLATLGDSPSRFNKYDQRKVKAIKLDDFIDEHHISHVDFMKIDTEGWELFVLKGAQKMIQRDHPVILMEYNESNMKQCGVSQLEVHELLKELGYEWKLISHEDILCVPKSLNNHEKPSTP